MVCTYDCCDLMALGNYTDIYLLMLFFQFITAQHVCSM